MADIHLTMGFTDYDHVRDMFSGRVKPEGIELTCLRMEVEDPREEAKIWMEMG